MAGHTHLDLCQVICGALFTAMLATTLDRLGITGLRWTLYATVLASCYFLGVAYPNLFTLTHDD